ncbi:MAG TPA: sulfate transporter family protein [Beijerinckiaceae bacterium]|jgi:CysZ protein|nr:sulfate transporter family protein [Beijerinckiaceae bacterium]
MLLQAAAAALRQTLSPPLRAILFKSLALTVALLALLWFALTRLLSSYLQGHPFGAEHPILEGFAYFLVGAGLLVPLFFMLPAVSALVAGFFLDDAAEIVERTDFSHDPPGQALPLGRALLYGLRFAGLSLVVNLAALLLVFVPVVNLVAFFTANAYLLGREYFEMAAARFRPTPEAAQMRVENRLTVLAAGALMAALLLVPVLNLLTPLFGIALMVHVHKRLAARSLSAPERLGRIR